MVQTAATQPASRALTKGSATTRGASLYLDADKTAQAVQAGWTAMEQHRLVRAFIMREFAGPWYNNCFPDPFGDGRPDSERRPLSLFKRLLETILPHLCGTEIKNKISPKLSGLRGAARLRELLLDHTCDAINLARTHRLVTMDALLGGLGLYKVGTRAGTGIIKVAGECYDVGQFYACRVDLDDFARDPLSRDPDEDTWRSVRYRVAKNFLLETGVFDNDKVTGLQTARSYTPNQSHSANIGASGNDAQDPLVEMVELVDVLVYEGDKVLECTIPAPGTGSGFLMEPREYEGPERGPLIEMRPRELPNNAFPVSVCAQLLDLHLLESAIATKAARRMIAKCRKIFYKPEESDTAMEVGNGTDDELLKGEWNGQAADMGGLDAGDVGAMREISTWTNNETPNLTQTSGAHDPNEKTATVGMIRQGNAQVRIADLKAMSDDALRRVVRCMGWDLDNDPFKMQQFSVRVPGGEMIDVLYDAAKKKGGFSDFLYDVQTTSQEPTDPRQKQAAFAQFMQASIPWLTGIAQLGGNVEVAVRVLSDVYNRPELDEIFPTGGAQQIDAAYAQAMQMPGAGGVRGMRPAGPMAPSLPRPGQVRAPVDQQRADMAGAMR